MRTVVILLASLLVNTSLPVAAASNVRMNQITVVGTHNSYKEAIPRNEFNVLRTQGGPQIDSLDYSHQSLKSQLNAGARTLELDVYRDPKGGRYSHPLLPDKLGDGQRFEKGDWLKPGLKVMHVADLDVRAHCTLFTQCLTQIRQWSDKHPNHVPILIMMNAKDESLQFKGAIKVLKFTTAGYDEIDKEIRQVFRRHQLITPDDIRGHYATLKQALKARGWPALDTMRGKVFFALDEKPAKVNLYRKGHPHLQGRVLFINSPTLDDPDAAYITLNHPIKDGAKIRQAVEQGMVVRTRADNNTVQARQHDFSHFKAALKSGAQYISTDYLFEDTRFAGYQIRLPNGLAAQCNTLIAPKGCNDLKIEPLLAKQKSTLTKVDPYIGADWGGRVFVGATVPFGMVKVGPDMETFDGWQTGPGYLSAGRILGFSHTHVSGTSGKYGNILVMPTSGVLNPADIGSSRSKESAQVDYYSAYLSRYQINAELTATAKVGLHRYRFDKKAPAHITVQLDHILQKGSGPESQRFLGGQIKVLSNHALSGVGRYSGGWNMGGEYDVYFYITTDKDANSVDTWQGNNIGLLAKRQLRGDKPLGAAFNYAATPGTVNVKVGISFVSEAQAKANVAQQAPGWNFDQIRQLGEYRWAKALGKVQVVGDYSRQRQFYTALYHSMLMPVNRTGENPQWQSHQPYYDDYYAIWDTFRTQGPLLTLIAPRRQRDLLRSLIDIYRHTGFMPDARSGNANGRTQGGSNSDVLIADAMVKDLQGIDYKTAFKAMLKNASVPPKDPRFEGRGGLSDYLQKGYVSTDYERAGSRTLEYSYDDFAIAEVACGLGEAQQMQKALKRASNWQNLWDPSVTRQGIKGFIRPRHADGSWAKVDDEKRGSWHDFFYEGDLWTYSLYAPQDVKALIKLSGGKKAFVHRMDRLFFGQHFDMSNEPGFLDPMLYLWAGRPDRTADLITMGMDRSFIDSRSGLPGNDDSGAMSSWLVFQLLGFYPNAGQDIYLIGTPGFAGATLTLGNGHKLRIKVKHFSPQLNRFVQSVTLNGKPLSTAWFHHRDIANGATLVFTMAAQPNPKWGQTPPPSLSDGDFAKRCQAWRQH